MKTELMEVPVAMPVVRAFPDCGTGCHSAARERRERRMIRNNVMPIDGDGPCCWSFCVQQRCRLAIHTPSSSNTLAHAAAKQVALG